MKRTKFCTVWIATAVVALAVLIGKVPVALALEAPNAVSFGEVRSNNAATVAMVQQSITVKNSGSTDVTLQSLDFSASDFALAAGSPGVGAIVPAGDGVTLLVEFNPSAEGAQNAQLTIRSDDPDLIINLDGTGTSAQLATSPAAIDFGLVALGSTSSTQRYSLARAASGTGLLTVTAVTVTGSDASYFELLGNAGQHLSCVDGQHCTFAPTLEFSNATARDFEVRCVVPAGDAVATRVATLSVTHDGDTGSVDSVNLQCTSARADLVVGATLLAYGAHPVGATTTLQLDLTNPGNLTTNVVIAKSGTNASDFTAATSVAVLPGATVSVPVSFTPSARGTRTATLTLTSNAINQPLVTVALTGSGQAPLIAAAPSPLAFPATLVGSSSSALDLTVTNPGELDLVVSNAVISVLASDFVISEVPASTTIAPGGTATWKVACRPTANGLRSGRLRFTSNALNAPTLNVALTCTGQTAQFTVAPSPFTYADTFENGRRTQNFTITNTGSIALDNLTASLGATTHFTIDAAPATSLAVGAATIVTVAFAPTADGNFTTTLLVDAMVNSTPLPQRAVTLAGRALRANFTLSTMAITGSKRFDKQLAGTFVVTNDAQASFQITSIAFTPTLGSATGDVVIAASDRGPFTLTTAGADVQRTIAYTVNAVNRVGTQAIRGTITVRSDLPTASGTLQKEIAVAIDSVSGMVVLGGDTAFGTIDIDTGATVTRNLTITNAPAAATALDITSVNTVNCPATFTITPPAVGALAPGGRLQFSAAYKPTTQQPPNQFEQCLISVGVSGDFNSPSAVQFVLTGRGIDRTLSLGAAPNFPATYRNPGPQAPVQNVTIANLGEAPLQVTPMLADNDGSWSLPNGMAEITVAAFAEVQIPVQFAPVAVRKSNATLLLAHNDNRTNDLVAEVALSGDGLSRNVNFGPGLIVFPTTAAGVRVTLSDAVDGNLVALANVDAATTFSFARLEVEGDNAFSLASEVKPAPLAPGASLEFDIAFAPETPGMHTATLRVYLDNDPVPHGEITLQGQAATVQLIGGAGCQSTHGGHSIGWILLVLGALGWPRRRAARLGTASLVTLTAVTAASQRAHAQAQNKNIDITVLRAAPTNNPQFLQTEPVRPGSENAVTVQLQLTHAEAPLVSRLDVGTMSEVALVKRRSAFELGVAYQMSRRFEVGVRLPFYLQSGSDTVLTGVTGVSANAFGDAAVNLRSQVWAQRQLAFGLGATVTLPTATKDQFAGLSKPSAAGRLLLGWQQGNIAVGLNAGVLVRAQTQFAQTQGSEALVAAAASLRVQRDVSVFAEAFGGKSLVSPDSAMGGAAMGLVGARVSLSTNVLASVAAGRGLVAGPGAPSLLATASLAFVARNRTSEGPRFAAPLHDADGDGLVGKKDQCPDAAEDKDLYADEDGCPDPDNDNDGVLDEADQCPATVEDRDGFADDDGCPDPDNDGDGIEDARDKCPAGAEDRDGFADQDGCPDPDNDNDGVDDVADKCVSQPETINGRQDNDGCPDQGPSAVALAADRIDFFESISFASNHSLTKSSANVLGQVAATLRAHREIKRIRVIVHVNERGARDEELSRKRAEALREWLIQWGIEGSRLDAKGFGASQMLVAPTAKNAAQINDRVEFIIMER